MNSEKDQLLDGVRSLKDEMSGLLNGVNYCLDWKASEEEWSIREVVCHLLDTPPGGMGAVLDQVLEGKGDEIVIHSSMTNLTPERKSMELADLCRNLEELLEQVEAGLVAAADSDLRNKTVPFTWSGPMSTRSARRRAWCNAPCWATGGSTWGRLERSGRPWGSASSPYSTYVEELYATRLKGATASCLDSGESTGTTIRPVCWRPPGSTSANCY